MVGADIPGTTIIGDDNSFGYHSVVGVLCQDLKYKVRQLLVEVCTEV